MQRFSQCLYSLYRAYFISDARLGIKHHKFISKKEIPIFINRCYEIN